MVGHDEAEFVAAVGVVQLVVGAVYRKAVIGVGGDKRINQRYLFTGAVALSRSMVGAHFFSDVLVGGTIGFSVCMLSGELFLRDRVHLKALKAG